jgi:hypothetical protein
VNLGRDVYERTRLIGSGSGTPRKHAAVESSNGGKGRMTCVHTVKHILFVLKIISYKREGSSCKC